MNAIIRPIEVRDAEALVPLLSALGYPTGRQAVAARLTRFLARGERSALLAETAASGAAGFGSVEVFDGLHDDAPVALITALVVAPEQRGRGTGAALVAALEDFAYARGCRRILVTSASRRLEAHAFYERLGYEKTGVRLGRQLTSPSGRA
jgi:GNAT superfamily N-acetyltransferase